MRLNQDSIQTAERTVAVAPSRLLLARAIRLKSLLRQAFGAADVPGESDRDASATAVVFPLGVDRSLIDIAEVLNLRPRNLHADVAGLHA